MRRFVTRLGRSFHYGEKGFTLIELLIVIAILGVLAAVVVPNVSRFTRSGQKAAALQEMQTVQTSIDAAMAEGGATSVPAGGFTIINGSTNTVNGIVVEEFLKEGDRWKVALYGRW